MTGDLCEDTSTFLTINGGSIVTKTTYSYTGMNKYTECILSQIYTIISTKPIFV